MYSSPCLIGLRLIKSHICPSCQHLPRREKKETCPWLSIIHVMSIGLFIPMEPISGVSNHRDWVAILLTLVGLIPFALALLKISFLLANQRDLSVIYSVVTSFSYGALWIYVWHASTCLCSHLSSSICTFQYHLYNHNVLWQWIMVYWKKDSQIVRFLAVPRQNNSSLLGLFIQLENR